MDEPIIVTMDADADAAAYVATRKGESGMHYKAVKVIERLNESVLIVDAMGEETVVMAIRLRTRDQVLAIMAEASGEGA